MFSKNHFENSLQVIAFNLIQLLIALQAKIKNHLPDERYVDKQKIKH